MKKKYIFLSLALSFIVLFLMCTNVQAKTNILFVGNSKTVHNNLAVIFSKLVSASEIDDVNVEAVATSGRTLEWDYNHSIKNNEKILNTKWDYVVLQEARSVLEGDLESLKKSLDSADVKSLQEASNDIINALKTKNKNIKVIHNAVWFQKANAEKKQSIINKNIEETRKITGGKIAYTGNAFIKTMKTYPQIELFSDKTHPSVAGSYLMACTLYATIYNESPEGIEYYGGVDKEKDKDKLCKQWVKSHSDLNKDTATKLQKMAAETMNVKKYELTVNKAPKVTRTIDNGNLVLKIADSSGIELGNIKIYKVNSKNELEEIKGKKLISHKVVKRNSNAITKIEFTLTNANLKDKTNKFYVTAKNNFGRSSKLYFTVRNKENNTYSSNFAPYYGEWELKTNNKVKFTVKNGGNIKKLVVYDLNNSNKIIAQQSNIESGTAIILNIKNLKTDKNGQYKIKIKGEDLQSLSRENIITFNLKK